jgi:hypothetical protein
MTADARVGPDGGAMDVIIEANGGPGGRGVTELSAETRADLERRRPDFDWEDAYGRGGGSAASVTAVSEARERVRVQAQANGGTADPEGLFGGDGGEAKAEVHVTALQSRDLDLDAQSRGGSARAGGSSGNARASVEAQSRGRIDASADAIAGIGENVEAVATTRATGTSGGLVARAGVPFGGQADRAALLTGRLSLSPGDLLTREAIEAVERLGPLRLSAAAGLRSEQTLTAGETAALALTPYPPGEPDALFAVALSLRHPLDEATAQVYRDSEDPQLQRLTQPLAVVLDLQWPTGTVIADYLARGTRLKVTGAAPELTLTGRSGDSDLDSIDAAREAGPTLESLFDDDWNISALLAGSDRATTPLDGLSLTFRLRPGDSLEGRLVVSRADY